MLNNRLNQTMSGNKKINARHPRLKYTISSVCALLACATTHSYAQQGAQQLEEIQITGSRISRDIGFESAVPVTAINTDELRMFDPGQGVSQQLENLPQFFNNVSSDNIAGRVTADVGQSQLNMRGMGTNRTLVLLDGLRVVPSDRTSSVSVDYLPSTLIQRVDVVTGGASAAYGSDALAGVTNFVLNRNFTGLDLAFSTGINEEGDGEFSRGSVTWGDDFLDDKLHLFGSIEARLNDAFRRENADWDTRQGYVMNPDWAAWRARTPASTPNTASPVPLRLTKNYVYSNAFTNTGLILTAAGSALNRMQFNNEGTGILPFQEGQFSSIAGQASTLNTAQGAPGQYQYDEFVNGHPQSLERVGVDQQNVFFGADFQLTENTKLWGHALYGRVHNDIEPSSSGASGTGLGHANLAYLTVFRENPYLPESVRQLMVTENRQSIRIDQHGFLGTEWGIREQPEVVNQIDSLTFGFTTENFIGDWNLRGSYQTGDAKKKNMNYNWERLDRFYLALDAVTDPATGQPMCRIKQVAQQLAAQGRNLEAELGAWSQVATTPSRYFFRGDFGAKTPGKLEPVPFPISVDSIDNTIKDCVPVNMFGRGKQSDAAMDYIFSERSKTGISTQQMDFAELLSSGTIMEGWAGPISGAIGATWRDTSIRQIIVDDAIDALGAPCNVTLPNGNITAVRGVAPSINCSATADSLHRFSGQPEFEGGFDVKEFFAETIVPLYDNGTQNAEIDVAARYSDYSRAGEFTSWKAGLNFQVTEDLRLRGTYSHDIREGSFVELFVQQGRGANINDPVTGQTYTTFNLTGGNPDLKAEEADTSVLGFVYQPSWLDGLSFSLDRYDVDLSDAIASFTEQQTVDECNRSGALCEYIIRGADGLIQTIRVQFININAAKVSGYDSEISYRMEPDFLSEYAETMNFRLIAGYMDENSTTPLNSPTVDRAGADAVTQGGGYLPKLTLTANLTYNIGDLGISLQQSHQGAVKRNALWVEGVDVDSNRIGSVNLTNLGLFWNHELASGSSWRTSFNVTNLFNRDPVLGGTARVGDDIGRRYALGFNYSF